MSLRILKAGVQTTIQGRPRNGFRHMGVPASGAADPLSMALANRLVGNASCVAALETTLSGVTLEFRKAVSFAISGATSLIQVNGRAIEPHCGNRAKRGDVLEVGATIRGARSYVAFAGGLKADAILGSDSTYLPAAFGGHSGRALKRGDELEFRSAGEGSECRTPERFRPPMSSSWMLRAARSCETAQLRGASRLFEKKLRVGNRNDRMGIQLEGETFTTDIEGDMPSAPVFPGIVQCPGDGSLFVLSVDAQTTGGYPRVAKVARADMHILGQLRPGDSLSLIERDDSVSAVELCEKQAYWREWLPDIADVI